MVCTASRKPKRLKNDEVGRRFARLSAARIEFIASDEFDQEDAAERILARELTPLRRMPTAKPAAGLQERLTRRLTEFELLPADEELDRFRRMNYWKHQAVICRARIDGRRPDAHSVRQLEAMLSQARELRDGLVQANMRLVISIAKQFADASNPLDDLISEGTMSLLRALEKFDYTRGFRFSTYATYAIRRNLYRFVLNRRKERARFDSRGAEIAETISEDALARTSETPWNDLQRRLAEILRQLDPREQLVIQARFGLGEKAEAETLQSLAARMAVCKERVRQLEKRALVKLRKMADQAALEDPGL